MTASVTRCPQCGAEVGVPAVRGRFEAIACPQCARTFPVDDLWTRADAHDSSSDDRSRVSNEDSAGRVEPGRCKPPADSGATTDSATACETLWHVIGGHKGGTVVDGPWAVDAPWAEHKVRRVEEHDERDHPAAHEAPSAETSREDEKDAAVAEDESPWTAVRSRWMPEPNGDGSDDHGARGVATTDADKGAAGTSSDRAGDDALDDLFTPVGTLDGRSPWGAFGDEDVGWGYSRAAAPEIESHPAEARPRRSPIVFLIQVVVGGIVGLGAGYLILKLLGRAPDLPF